jgi:hypothetical protein
MIDTTTRFDCSACGRRIPKRALHPLCGDDLVVCCTRCLGSHQVHAELYPDCPKPWHDVYDHPLKLCSLAAARLLRKQHREGPG